MSQVVLTEIHGRVGLIRINRPEAMNALNNDVVDGIGAAIDAFEADEAIGCIVLTGNEKAFSAGADLNWMKRASQFTHEQNVEDARKFAGMLRALSGMSKPTIARVQGAALGGGTGLTAACDMAIASDDAVFSTSEVKFGIIPAVISPYVLRAIGPRHALRYFQSAERISAHRALMIGLVGEVVPLAELDACVDTLADTLLQGGPLAQKAAKDLIAAVNGKNIDDSVSEETAQRIARQRATDEARDGISAFLEKRPPAWLA